jgi:hypothetical protein
MRSVSFPRLWLPRFTLRSAFRVVLRLALALAVLLAVVGAGTVTADTTEVTGRDPQTDTPSVNR